MLQSLHPHDGCERQSDRKEKDADRRPTPWRGRELFLPDMGIGRLVERPTEIMHYINGYLEGGNSRLATYRDSDRPTFVGAEFKSMVDRIPSLTEYLRDLKSYLLNFPKASLPKAESFGELLLGAW